MSEVWLDPVEDGKPRKSYIITLGIVGFAVLCAWELAHHDWTPALRTGVIAYLFWIIQQQRLIYWMHGYMSAAKSVKEQAQEHAE